MADRIFAMLTAQPASRLRRTATWVLAAWLCVLFAGVWTPVARAHASQQQTVYLCSGELAPPGTPSPLAAAEHDALLHHTLDCPLCMPVLALPDVPLLALSTPQPQAQPVALIERQLRPARLVVPPARGPPSKIAIS